MWHGQLRPQQLLLPGPERSGFGANGCGSLIRAELQLDDEAVVGRLVLPAAGLGVLWLFAPRGLADLWSRASPERGVLRGWMLGCVAHLLLVVCLATPSGRDDRALSFAASGLRAGVAVVPLVVIAGLAGLGRVEGKTRTALQGTVESGDARPTDQAYAVFKELSGRLDKQLARLDGMLKTELPAFNKQLTDRKLEPIKDESSSVSAAARP